MSDNFEAYIDALGQLDDDDLYADIDETMEKRYIENMPIKESKCYVEEPKKRT